MSARRVEELMQRTPQTLERNDSLLVADQMMTMRRIRHLPVLDENGNLAGIISQRDLFFNALLRALGFGTFAKDKALDELRVKHCMTDDVVTIAPQATVSEAAQLMLEKKIGCLPVVEDKKLVGLVTESDLVAELIDS